MIGIVKPAGAKKNVMGWFAVTRLASGARARPVARKVAFGANRAKSGGHGRCLGGAILDSKHQGDSWLG